MSAIKSHRRSWCRGDSVWYVGYPLPPEARIKAPRIPEIFAIHRSAWPLNKVRPAKEIKATFVRSSDRQDPTGGIGRPRKLAPGPIGQHEIDREAAAECGNGRGVLLSPENIKRVTNNCAAAIGRSDRQWWQFFKFKTRETEADKIGVPEILFGVAPTYDYDRIAPRS
jgi:hypothetical protein